jgi:hypothetical protein
MRLDKPQRLLSASGVMESCGGSSGMMAVADGRS